MIDDPRRYQMIIYLTDNNVNGPLRTKYAFTLVLEEHLVGAQTPQRPDLDAEKADGLLEHNGFVGTEAEFLAALDEVNTAYDHRVYDLRGIPPDTIYQDLHESSSFLQVNVFEGTSYP